MLPAFHDMAGTVGIPKVSPRDATTLLERSSSYIRRRHGYDESKTYRAICDHTTVLEKRT